MVVRFLNNKRQKVKSKTCHILNQNKETQTPTSWLNLVFLVILTGIKSCWLISQLRLKSYPTYFRLSEKKIYLVYLFKVVTKLTLFSNVSAQISNFKLSNQIFFFKIGIHSMQGWTATTRYGVTRKRTTKRLKHTGNLFRKTPQPTGVC